MKEKTINFLRKKFSTEKKDYTTIFSESPLKTSFYEELQKNEWCNVISDKPETLTTSKLLKDKLKLN